MARARKTSVEREEQREFPQHPRVGVGGIVIDRDRVLLVRRGQAPLKGEWSIPGGLVELGESLKEAVEREIQEETGLLVRPIGSLGVFERVIRATKPRARRGKVRYHYVLIDFLCELRRAPGEDTSDQPQPWTDVTDARWVSESELRRYRLSGAAREVIKGAFSHSRNVQSNLDLAEAFRTAFRTSAARAGDSRDSPLRGRGQGGALRRRRQ